MGNQIEHHSVTVCMGSSCFAHGSGEILEAIQKYLSEHSCEASVEITGSLCQGICKKGPTITIDNKCYTHLTVEKALVILGKNLNQTGNQ